MTPNNNNELLRIAAVQNKYAETLLAYPNVIGMGIGYRRRGAVTSEELRLVVLVRRKLPREQLSAAELLPCELDGLPLDVIESGEFSTL